MCLVLTDDTRQARPERLEEVEEVCRRWTCDGSVTREQTHKSIGHLVHLARTGCARHVFSLARLFESNADTGQCPAKSDREDVSCQNTNSDKGWPCREALIQLPNLPPSMDL